MRYENVFREEQNLKLKALALRSSYSNSSHVLELMKIALVLEVSVRVQISIEID